VLEAEGAGNAVSVAPVTDTGHALATLPSGTTDLGVPIERSLRIADSCIGCDHRRAQAIRACCNRRGNLSILAKPQLPEVDVTQARFGVGDFGIIAWSPAEDCAIAMTR